MLFFGSNTKKVRAEKTAQIIGVLLMNRILRMGFGSIECRYFENLQLFGYENIIL